MNVSFYTPGAAQLALKGCTGLNKKNILLMSNRSEIPGQLPFLQKVLRAVDIDLEDDVHFLIVESDLNVSILSDPDILAYETVITFGLKPSQLGIQEKDGPITRLMFYERITCLISPALSTIADEPAQKKQLWNALKAVFQS